MKLGAPITYEEINELIKMIQDRIKKLTKEK